MPKKLLTVDDSKTIRMIVTRAFKPFDLTILEASNGVEGLAVAAQEKPDVIILDITMPVMDGYEMLGKLRADPELKNTPVVMLTAEAGKDNVLKIAKMGVRDYLVKPFKEDLVVERIGRIIELKPRSTEPAAKKKYSDPLKILVVDDKPAIVDQIRAALSQTPWKVEGAAQPKIATDYFMQQLPDAVVISLSLPDNASFALFDALRPSAQARNVPLLGTSIKTAAPEQQRALTAGFAGIITKPIEAQDVHEKLVKVLNLDTSAQYFVQKDGALAVNLPAGFNEAIAEEVAKHLQAKVNESVDAGLGKVVVDLSQLRAVDVHALNLCAKLIKLCQDLGLKHALIGSELVCTECANHSESVGWRFASSWADALASMDKPSAMAA